MSRYTARVALSCFFGGVALWLGTWYVTGSEVNWPQLPDDAFYYYQVAKNIGAGYGSTMDTLNPTNGYHPLWMLLNIPIFIVARDSPELALALVQLLVLSTTAVSMALLFNLLCQSFDAKTATIAIGILFYPSLMSIFATGLESSLVVLMMAVSARRICVWSTLGPKGTARDKTLVGLSLAFLMLSRLDSVFYLFSFAVYVCIQELKLNTGSLFGRLSKVARTVLSIFWPVLLLILPYLIWNTTVYGSIVPISGFLKTTFPVPGLHVAWLNGLKAVGVLLLVAYAASALSYLRKTDDGLSRVLIVLTGGASLHLVYTVIFMNWAVFGWHFVGCLVPGVIGLAYLVRPAMSFLPQAARVAVAALVISTTSGLLVRRYVEPDSSFRAAAIAGGKWAKEHLPEDAILGMKDSGAFTYFSGKRVVNLDGVANSMAYQRALCSGGVEIFLARLDVRYIVQHAVNVDKIRNGYGSFEQVYPCHLRGGEDGRLVLNESQEIYRGPEYYDDGVLVSLVVWRAGWTE